MRCFVCGNADAEYGLNDLDCAEFFADQFIPADPKDPPPSAPASVARDLAHLDFSCACPLDALFSCELGAPRRCDAKPLPHQFQKQANGRIYCPECDLTRTGKARRFASDGAF